METAGKVLLAGAVIGGGYLVYRSLTSPAMRNSPSALGGSTSPGVAGNNNQTGIHYSDSEAQRTQATGNVVNGAIAGVTGFAGAVGNLWSVFGKSQPGGGFGANEADGPGGYDESSYGGGDDSSTEDSGMFGDSGTDDIDGEMSGEDFDLDY